MRDMKPCVSYRPGKICADGFPAGYPAASACSGITCHSCGKPNDKLPPCQNEDLHPRWLNDDGSPKFYHPTSEEE